MLHIHIPNYYHIISHAVTITLESRISWSVVIQSIKERFGSKQQQQQLCRNRKPDDAGGKNIIRTNRNGEDLKGVLRGR